MAKKIKFTAPGPWNNTPEQQSVIDRLTKLGIRIFYGTKK